MSYRDDRDAMLARMAALERQAADAERLRARVRELELENQRLVDELSRLLARYEPPPPPPAAPPSTPRSIALRISGPGGDRDQTFQRETIKIGRVPSCHVQLDDPLASRLHAVIECTSERAFLLDLGSASSTLLNGQRVIKAELRHGDRIDIGATALIVGLGPP